MEELHPDNRSKEMRRTATPLMLAILLSSILLPRYNAAEIHAVSFQLPLPPFLSGPLRSNAILAEAERGQEGNISAPHSYVRYKEEIFAVTAPGTVVNVVPCTPVVIADLAPRSCNGPNECGHLVSIRLSSRGTLLVLDAYRGVFEVHPITGVTRQLYNSKTVVNGRPSQYLSDLMELPDGRILISDASATFDYASRFWIMFEGRADGRLLGLNPTTGQVEEIMAGLAYPSGLELTIDKRAFLVSEASRSRIYRVELSKDRRFFKSFFIENLPGMPQHIRQASKGTSEAGYWVGLTFPRYQGDISVLDQYSAQPAARNFLAKRRSEQQLKMMYNRRGLAVELDANGRIIRSMHDPTSSKITEVTEVNEHDGLAYVGSRNQNAFLRVMTSASRLSIDTMIQVMRSRCKVTEDKIPEAKEALRRQIMSRKNAAKASSTQSGQMSQSATSAAHEQKSRQQTLGFGGGIDRSEARTSTSIRQGLSRIQKILNRRGLQNKKKTRANQGVQQMTTSPQSPKQLPTPPVTDSWTSKGTLPLLLENIPQEQATYQQQNPLQLPPENFFNQQNKQIHTKMPGRMTQQKNLQNFPAQNRGGSQAQSFLDLSMPNNDIFSSNMMPPFPQNIPNPPNVLTPPNLYSQPIGGSPHVYAPNGNVPLPFSATGYQNSFSRPNQPQTSLTNLNLGQPPDPYQRNSRGPKSMYVPPPPNNAPADPNSPFLPHGLVPTGHHTAVQNTHHDHSNKPQIVHKVVNGQMITQIIVPDLDTILYDTVEQKTTMSPLIIPTPKPVPYKADMFKPRPTPQTSHQNPPQAPLKKSPQSETQKKLALGGFLGIASKHSNNNPVEKPPLFNLGPEMVNTLPEFGQMPGSALDAPPVGNGIYGLDSTDRPPTAAQRNAAIALNMFTGVTGPNNSIPEKQQPNWQDLPTTPTYQDQEQNYVAQSQLSNQDTIIGTAQEIPRISSTVDNKNSLNKEITNMQRMQMFHPSDGSIPATSSENIDKSVDAKSTYQDTKQSLLKRGLQQLHQLFRKENSENSQASQIIHNTTKKTQDIHIQPVFTTAPTPKAFPIGAIKTSRTLSSPTSSDDHQQHIMTSVPKTTPIPTSDNNSASPSATGNNLVNAHSGVAAIHSRQKEDLGKQDSSLFSNLAQSHSLREPDGSNQTPQLEPIRQPQLPQYTSPDIQTNSTNQIHQSFPNNGATQPQQSGDSHGFVQIYQNGKYIVIPLSQSILRTLSSSLGAAVTNQESPSMLPVTSSHTGVSSVDSQKPVALAQQTGPQAAPHVSHTQPHSSGNGLQKQTGPQKSIPTASNQPVTEGSGSNTITGQQHLPVDEQQVTMNEGNTGPSSFVQSFMG